MTDVTNDDVMIMIADVLAFAEPGATFTIGVNGDGADFVAQYFDGRHEAAAFIATGMTAFDALASVVDAVDTEVTAR